MACLLKECCCGCPLKTGTIILGVIGIVSANFPSTLLALYRNGSSFSQEKTTLKLKKLHFNDIAKLLAISIQITLELSTAILANCLKSPRKETWIPKNNTFTFFIHQTKCQQDFGACGRLEYSRSACHITYSMVQSPSWEANWFAASQEIPRILWNRRFITALTSVFHLSLTWASPIQSTYPHPTSWRYILIIYTHLRLGLPSGLFPSGFPTKNLYIPLSYPYLPHAQPISFFSILSPAQY